MIRPSGMVPGKFDPVLREDQIADNVLAGSQQNPRL